MNRCLYLVRHFTRLRPHTRAFYASRSPPLFEEDEIRAKLRPLTGQGGDILLNYKTIDEPKGIGVITICNASRKNALTGHMMVQLAEIVDKLEVWSQGKAVILHGDEGTFTSGADISVVKEILSAEDGAKMCFFMHRTLTRLRRLPLVSLALVEGKAIGGGAELTTACDFRIMSKDAEIRFVQARMNVSPGWGGGARLVKLVGRQKALEILLQCKKMNVVDSLKCGLVDGELVVSDKKDVLETAADWLEPYLESDSSVIRANKGVVAAGDDLTMDDALKVERSIFGSVWGSETAKHAFTQNIKHASCSHNAG